ncbi:hypothetical protein BC828DRAFT_390031 [Blastocladiella britannica]|nr:hypothetical protein BC828DRAFT_390031 [Blastocladiella britannica]
MLRPACLPLRLSNAAAHAAAHAAASAASTGPLLHGHSHGQQCRALFLPSTTVPPLPLPPSLATARRSTALALRHPPPPSALALLSAPPVRTKKSSRRVQQPRIPTRSLDWGDASVLDHSSSANSTNASAVKPGDWECPHCRFVNYASRDTCRSCGHVPSAAERAPPPSSSSSTLVVTPRAAAVTHAVWMGKPIAIIWADGIDAFASVPITEVDEDDLGDAEVAGAEPIPPPPPPPLLADSDRNTAETLLAAHPRLAHAPSDLADALVAARPRLSAHIHVPASVSRPAVLARSVLLGSPSSPPLPKHRHQKSQFILTGDWICPRCSVANHASRLFCFKCGLPARHPAVRRAVVIPVAVQPALAPLLASVAMLSSLLPSSTSSTDASAEPEAPPTPSRHDTSTSVTDAVPPDLRPLVLDRVLAAVVAQTQGMATERHRWVCTECYYVNRGSAGACRKCGEGRTASSLIETES